MSTDNNEEEYSINQSYDQYLNEEKEERRKLQKKLRDETGQHVPVVMTKENGLKSVNELDYEEQKNEIINCALDPIYFIETYLTIFDQTRGEAGEIVSFKLFEFQKKLINDYQNHRFNIANKYRQAGISTCTCAYLAWYIMFNSNRGVAIVANKLETAQNELMSDVVDFIECCPKFLKPKPDKKDTQKLKIYTNGSSIGAFSAKAGLRGYTPTLIFWDEVAWTERGDEFWKAAGPTMQTGGRAIFVSTPQGLDAIFYKYFEGARRKENNFNAVELWWFNDPRYIINESGEIDLEWVKNKGREDEIRLKDDYWSEEKRIQMMDDGWEATSSWFEDQIKNANNDMRKIAQELLCSFLGSGDNFIAEIYLRDIEENYIKTPIREEYIDKNMWIWDDPEELAEYIMPIDVSSGHGEDSSTINIIKIEPIVIEKIIKKHGRKNKIKIKTHKGTQVAEYYGKVTPQELGEIAYIFGKKYNNAYAIVDVTGGRGAQTVEKLFELGYEEKNIHYSEITHKPTRDRLNGYIKQSTKTLPDGTQTKIDLIPGFFIGGNRGSVLVEMERAIRMSEIDVRSLRLLNEFKTFVTVNGSRVADHKRSFHDDSIMSLSIGIYVMNFELKKFDLNPEKTKKMLDAMMKVDSNTVVKKTKTYIKTMKDNVKIKEKTTYVIEKRNPYGEHAWLFHGLNKKR